jgi:hemolysin activation/secretion protein
VNSRIPTSNEIPVQPAKTRHPAVVGLSGLLLALAGSHAMAQAVPDAATLDRQQRDSRRLEDERERLLNPPAPNFKAPPPEQAGPGSAGPSFVLKGVEFNESRFFTKAELDAFVAPYLEQRIDFATLQKLVGAVNESYRAKGQYIARAIVPPQSVRDGMVKISLVESRAGKTTITGAARINPAVAQAWLAPTPGEVIDLPALDMRVSRFMRATDAEAAVQLNEGSTVGYTDLTVAVKEPPALGLRAFISNEGNQLTGREQAGADLRWFSPLGRGDKALANLIYSRGAQSLSGGYALPFNQLGGVVGLTLSRGKSNIISGPFAAIGVEGKSASEGLNVRHPLGSTGPWQFDGNAGITRYSSENTIGGVSTGEVRTHIEQGSVSAGWRGTDADFNASLQLSTGRATAASGLTLAGRSTAVDLSWVQRFKAGALAVQVHAQNSQSGSLPSLMQLSLGGAGSVRGYSVGSFIADNGYSASVEYHFRVTDTARGFVFVDNARGSLASGASQKLGSAGVGGEWQFAQKTSLAATVSQAFNSALVTGSRTRLAVKLTQEF